MQRGGANPEIGVPGGGWVRVAAVLLLLALTAAAYLPVLRAGFVFDDRTYLLANAEVLNGLTWRGVVWAFTSHRYASNWHPLTWLSLMADVSLFARAPAGFHAVNLLLHLLNIVLLFLAVRALMGRFLTAFLVAALFALHPVHVESVAWVTERKDVLSALFWMLTLLAYVRHVRRPSLLRLAAVGAAMAASLMAKPMAVTLPAILLLLDFWPLGRHRSTGWGALIAEKTPLFVLALASALMTWTAQSTGSAMRLAAEHDLGDRAANAVVSYARYIGKLLWPSGLAALYPFPRTGYGYGVVLASGLLILALTIGAIAGRSKGWPLTGWLWYLIALLPVSGLVLVGPQAMADRYAYLPAVGLYLALGWWVAEWARRSATRMVLTASLACVCLGTLGFVTHAQTAWWKDDETLFRRAVTVTSGNWVGLSNLGEAVAKRGRIDEAQRHFEAALAIEPRSEVAHYNLGVIMDLRGRYDLAMDHYRAAIAIRPGYAVARANLGGDYLRLGDITRAKEQLAEALRLDPGDRIARLNMALANEARRK